MIVCECMTLYDYTVYAKLHGHTQTHWDIHVRYKLQSNDMGLPQISHVPIVHNSLVNAVPGQVRNMS